MKTFYWHAEVWQQLLSAPESLPHAVLLAGPTGLGKLAFAQAMAARLLCEAPVESVELGVIACGQCSSCVWLASGNHPDFRIIQPEEEETNVDAEAGAEGGDAGGGVAPKKAKSSKSGTRSSETIRIDQIRALADFAFVGSHRHGRRIVILHPAEAMTPAAANALLKILEEPPAYVYFIMVSSSWRKLLPTIRSRCRMVVFGRPEPKVASDWLAAEGVKDAANLLRLAGGAPLLALDWAQKDYLDSYRKAIDVLAEKPVDPVAMAAKWSSLIKGGETFELPQLVEAVQKWVFDLVQLKITGELRYHVAWQSRLSGLASRANVTALLACYNDLLRIRAVVRHPLNTQLFLEDMAARYSRALIANT